ncbi:MAG TPA: hypothetical protein VKK30_01965, partial [Actinomycetota bacterium]|nr:hypothetical protein [Actinomycetota bacterium]
SFQISPDPTDLAAEQIAGVLQAAQQAAKRIVDTAQDRMQAQLTEMDRQRRQLDTETRELTTWRDQVRSLVGSLSSDVDAFRDSLGEIPHRLSQAFAPMAERIPALQKEMADLVGALGSASSLFPSPPSPEERPRTQTEQGAPR